MVGAYPMHDEIRSLFRAKTSVSYAYTADCTEEQKDKGELFYVDLGTSFNEPEVIDNLYFYNYFDIISDEEKERQRKEFCEGPDRDDPIIGGGCENYPLKK